MDAFWYYAVLAVVKTLQALPVRLVATMGRWCGAVAYVVDRKHRRVACDNLRRCFPDKSSKERQAIAREHFRRLGENFAAAIPTAGMSNAEIAGHLEVIGTESLQTNSRGAIVAIGHFGNFELYTHMVSGIPHLRGATTYRALEQPRLDGLLREWRSRSGCRFFDRRRDVKEMLRALQDGGVVLGLLCDQHAGRKGVRIPFFGHECSTTLAPAKLAQKYQLPLFTAVCFRVGLGQWRIEMGKEIPTRIDARLRPAAEVMSDVNAAFETAVRRDPANSFWVQDRWRFARSDREALRAARAEADQAKNYSGNKPTASAPRA